MKFLMAYTPGFREEMFRAFEDLGLELIRRPDSGRLGCESLPCDMDVSDVDMILCYRFFNHHDVTRFTGLKYVHTTSSGLDHMPMDYLRSRGVVLDNARGVYSVPMAEYALSGVLQLYRGAPTLMERQQQRLWLPFEQPRELGGKRVTLLGTGSVGTECAKRFSSMGCRCTGLCRHPAAQAEHYERQLHIDRLDQVLPETDILLLTLPLTAETRGLMDARRFALLPEGAVLVNVARGPIVVTDALLDALESGHLAGAVLDVTEEEPLPAAAPLWSAKNLILTPHNSFAGEHNPQRLFDLVYKDIVNWLNSRGGTL